MKLLLSTLFSFLVLSVTAQLNGYLTDPTGEPLPFANIYLQGTTTGTNSNTDGYYELKLPAGEQTVVFQYVGYESKTVVVDYNGTAETLNVTLQPESIELGGVVISANEEDPAYPIIRKAIAKRRYYRDQIENFRADVYIKGMVQLEDVPEKILGQEIGDIDGSLDSTRSGVVYLSESVSELYYQRDPRKTREVMISSKVSGNDRGFSFNSARDMNFSLYESQLDFGRAVVSPIAEGAFGIYRFKLVGTIFDEANRLINKIEVIPKNPTTPAYRGFLYITEDLWNIQSADLYLLGKTMHIPGFDTLYWQQTYIPVAEPDTWALFQQTFRPRGGFFGIRFGGRFVGIYRNYDLQPEFPEGFFDGGEVLYVEPDANQRDTAYWNNIRPLPLTRSERTDYRRKDSIQVVRSTPEYLDSIDRVANKFKPLQALTGYTYQNSQKNTRWTFGGLGLTNGFNTVGGVSLGTNIQYMRGSDKEYTRYWRAELQPVYTFADERVRVTGRVGRLFDRIHDTYFGVFGGTELRDLNSTTPISPAVNTWYSLLYRRNPLKLYERTSVGAIFQRELVNGLRLVSQLTYYQHRALNNRTDYSFRKATEDRFYSTNHPTNPFLIGRNLFPEYQQLLLSTRLRIRPGQRYQSYPNRRFKSAGKFPAIYVSLDYAMPLNLDYTDYLEARIELRRYNIPTGKWGSFDMSIAGGGFLRNERSFFPDWQHFRGNSFTYLAPTDGLQRQFFRLPVYEYSTASSYFEGHYQHHFRGFLLDRVPLLKKLGFETVISARTLLVDERDPYVELGVGIENIGFGLFRLLRVDFVGSFREGAYDGVSVVVSAPLGGNN